ncbi:MAG: hypothetical protein M1829_005057 [Trizodia sp. TS-e1964]|nr:MAG: hypothetical protein M1829_005057 [Trizodia sp. TS-e1964]
MSTKVPVPQKGAMTGREEWRMGINISKASIYDLVEVPKPRTTISQKSISKARDKARGRLAARQQELANARSAT